MKDAPGGLRLRIALFGRRNAGKSSLLNALTGQDVAIVSDTPGTTADPVEKILEMAPLGPTVFLDTAGLDDVGDLGALRVESALKLLPGADLAIIVTAGPDWGPTERDVAARLRSARIPFLVARNKADLFPGDAPRPEDLDPSAPVIRVSARTGEGLDDIRAALERLAPESALDHPPLLHDLLPEAGVLLLVTPIDSGAPRGRLILPQVQAIRDALDGRKICLVATEGELSAALDRLKSPPDLVVCDSQVAEVADRLTPPGVPMTTFSILMARLKGDLDVMARGAAALHGLRPGDPVRIQEACSHHPQKDDIGRVKLPRMLARMAGGDPAVSVMAGKDFVPPEDGCRVVIHCGGCVLTRRQMLSHLHASEEAGVPMTNYGVAITLAKGVLRRALGPFPDALRAYDEAVAGLKPPA